MLMTQTVSTHTYDTGKRDLELLASRRNTGQQPGDVFCVSEAEDEFVDYAVDADGAGDKAEGCVGRVGEDEVVGVEGC